MTHTELIGGAIGSALLGLGGAAVIAWALHPRRPERVLFFFGMWCSLYGARLIVEQPAIVEAIGGSARFWSYVRAFITYAINVPIGLFLEGLVGAGWKQSVRRYWQIQAVYAVGAIAFDLAVARPSAAMPLNSPIVLGGVVIGLANVWMFNDRLSRSLKTRAIGVCGIAALVLVSNENLGRPIAPSINLEPLGIFAFVAALGYGVVAGVFRHEAALVSVQRELDTARRIQSSLLPRDLPRVTGLDIAARYLPMSAVAGDLYDVVRAGPSHVGILVADVSGHGIPAALVASMVKLAFSMQADHAHDPAGVLTVMNRLLCRHLDGTFVTAIYAVIDTQARVLTIGNAGHPGVLIGRSDGPVEQSVEHGVMLGLFPGAEYTNERLELREGDRILVYTDGIPEAQRADGEFLDTDRLRQWISTTRANTAAECAESLLTMLEGWRDGRRFDDDVTFVVAGFSAAARQH
jgi:hypothetical protein